MNGLSLRSVFRSALIAGVVAGVLVAAFHFIATEPVIDQAIALEEQLRPMDEAHDEPAVTRQMQRGGLVLGFLLYGLTWSVLVGAVYLVVQRWLPARGPALQGALLTLFAYWSVGLLPFLKYPANPPGVGDPDTITYRQGLYVDFLVLSLLGVAAALAAGRYVGARANSGRAGWLAGLAFLGAYSAATYVLMPSNPDPIRMPGELVGSFRALSLAGVTLFWGLLALIFGVLLRSARAAPAL